MEMNESSSENITLGGMDFILIRENYENEYNYLRQYECHQLLTDDEMYAVIDDFAGNLGSVKGIRLYYRDVNNDESTEQICRYYESVEEFHADTFPDSWHCVRLWIEITIEDKPIEYDIFNHKHEEGQKQYAYMLTGCHDKTCGGTVNTIVYYMHDGEPVKCDKNGDKFYYWDEKNREWVRSHSLWCDFFGWDGWGDGVGEFDEIGKEDVEKLLHMGGYTSI